MTRELICIGCPMGCRLTAEIEDGAVTHVTGNTCRRGEEYAKKECVAPMRTVTGTVALRGLTAMTSTPVPHTSRSTTSPAWMSSRSSPCKRTRRRKRASLFVVFVTSPYMTGLPSIGKGKYSLVDRW